MKCPKCSYISFDYNQVCPKCNRDISTEQVKFNLPSFRPNPPSLLGFLVGDANESYVDLPAPSGSRISDMSHDDLESTDSPIMDHDKMEIEDHDLDLSFEPGEDTGEDLFEMESAGESENELSDADFRLEEKDEGDIVTPSEAVEEEEDISMDLGELDLDDSVQPVETEEEAKAAPSTGTEDTEPEVDISLDSLVPSPDSNLEEIESEIELDLDDLKISDIGNLEVGEDIELSDKDLERTLTELEEPEEKEPLEPDIESYDLSDEGEETLPEVSDIIPEEDTGGKEQTIMLDDSGPSKIEEPLDLGDAPLEDFSLDEEALMELGDLDMDSNSSDGIEKTLNLDDLSKGDSEDLERSFDISDMPEDYSEDETIEQSAKESFSDSSEIELDLDAMSSDVDNYQKEASHPGDDDFDLDLDDMDIDLDLNEPKK